MNERPTPETDASRGYALTSHYGRAEGSYLQMDKDGPFVHAEVARKLERERDEAREAIISLENKLKCAVEMADMAELERDKAWSCCDELVVDSNAVTLAKTVMMLEKERDEAREVLQRIADADWKSAGELRGIARETLEAGK